MGVIEGKDDDVCAGWRMVGYGNSYNSSSVRFGGFWRLFDYIRIIGVIGWMSIMFVKWRMVGYGNCHNSSYVEFGRSRELLCDIGVMGILGGGP